jgi:hypothetical protein
MASFPRVNPQPFDGNAVAVFGHEVDFFEIDFGANIANPTQLGPNGAWPLLISQIEQNATIEVLGQIGTLNLISNAGNLSTSGGAVRVVLSGKFAWTAANLQSTIQSLGTIVVGNGAIGFSNVNVASTIVNTFTF